MKKRIVTLCLLLAVGCSLVACGPKEDPVMTIPVPTTPVEDTSSVGTNIPSEVNKKEYTDLQYCEAVIHSVGFIEFYTDLRAPAENMSQTFIADKLLYGENQFDLDFQYANWSEDGTATMLPGWHLYGAKGQAPVNISPYKTSDYMHVEEFTLEEQDPSAADNYCQTKEYLLYNLQNDQPIDVITVIAYYYPSTNNIYNLVREHPDPEEANITMPELLVQHKADADIIIPRNLEVIWEDNFPIETAEFVLQAGEVEETYRYRLGMTLSTWATSELNTSSWFVGFNETLFSADYKYMVPYGEVDLRYHITEGGKITAVENTEYDIKELQEAFTFNFTPTTQAHLINWKTPLLLPGIRIESDYTGYYIPQNFNIGHIYGIDDTLNIYLTGITEEMLPHVKIYALAETEEIVNIIRNGDGLSSHFKATPETSAYLKVSEKAFNIPLQKADHSHAEEYGYAPMGELVAIYKPAEDPNFSAENERALAITYNDELVYWIHMPIFSSDIVDETDDEYLTEEEFQDFLKEMEEQGVIVEEVNP